LKRLEVLGLFNNEIFNERKTIEVIEKLTNLKELSIDGNPVSILFIMKIIGFYISQV
jgi:hypothetical protein